MRATCRQPAGVRNQLRTGVALEEEVDESLTGKGRVWKVLLAAAGSSAFRWSAIGRIDRQNWSFVCLVDGIGFSTNRAPFGGNNYVNAIVVVIFGGAIITLMPLLSPVSILGVHGYMVISEPTEMYH